MIKGILKRLTRPKPAPRRPIDALIARRAQRPATGIARSRRPMSGCRRSCSGATMTEMDTIPRRRL